MMDSHDRSAAAHAVVVVGFDQCHGPQGLVAVQRLSRQGRGESFKCQLSAGCGQVDVVNVIVDVEMFIVEPVRARWILQHALAKAFVAQQAVRQGAFEARRVHRGVEHQDADDHHEVGRCVHAQPGGIDVGHALTVLELIDHLHRVAGEFVERNTIQGQVFRQSVQRQVAGPFEDLFECCHWLLFSGARR